MSEAPADWPQVHRWRCAQRQRLLRERASQSAPLRAARSERIVATIERLLAPLTDPELAFYWPYRFEVDLRQMVTRLCGLGVRASLPVVTARNRPLEFRRWHPGAALERNALGIPVPAAGETVRPQVALVPLLGFDAANYRLGLGGGYFDRTLAQPGFSARTIGVGFELARLDTIHPQPHDIALDQVVTEAGLRSAPGSAAPAPPARRPPGPG